MTTLWRSVVASFVATLVSLPTGAQAATCREIDLPVAFAQGAPRDQTVSGTLCAPSRCATNRCQVDVLVHGGTYNRTYWDFPLHSPVYSYVKQTLQWGRATFAIDLPGVGNSSRPPSPLVTLAATGHALHEVVQWLREQGYTHVNLVGQSVGAAFAIYEAGTYQDVDRVVATGMLHGVLVDPDLASRLLYPAAFDPQFAGQNLDLGYFTRVSAEVPPIYYFQPGADANVIAYELAHKDVGSITSMFEGAGSAFAPPGLNVSNLVRAPVLHVIGAKDALYCNANLACSNATIEATEAAYYTSARSVTARVIPYTGQNLALHYTSQLTTLLINDWISRTPPAP